MTQAPSNLFSIPAGEDFIHCLAETLLNDKSFGGAINWADEQADAGAFALSDFTVLLPTRRAVRELRQKLLALSDTDSLLLPDIRTLADVDEMDLFFALRHPEVLDVKPVIPSLQREAYLLREVLAWQSGQAGQDGQEDIPQSVGAKSDEMWRKQQGHIVQAADLSADLAAFLDQAQTEEIDLSRLEGLVADNFADNWRQTLAFLSIITQKWPAEKARLDGLDPSEYRNLLIRLQAEIWHKNQPRKPIIAAGSTGSIPATADLLKEILALPNGVVVLPGLDLDMPSDVWAQLVHDPAHPQSGLYHMMEKLETSRQNVRIFPSAEHHKNTECVHQLAARRQFVNLALLPSEQTYLWSQSASESASGTETATLDLDKALSGFSVYEAPDMRREAGVIALAMREILETSDKKAILITPDRHLARRVSAELKRWDINIDDTAGVSLSRHAVGLLVRLILDARASHYAPVALLALLKHSMVCLADTRAQHLELVQEFDFALRQGGHFTETDPARQGAYGLESYRLHIQALIAQTQQEKTENAYRYFDKRLKDLPALDMFLEKLIEAMQHMSALTKAESPAQLAQAVRQTMPLLMGRDIGAASLETARAEEELLAFFDSLAVMQEPVEQEEWPHLFDLWLARKPIRPQKGLHPRLAIMGLLEARLVQADLMILGGLNEGVWPQVPDTGPWVSRPMRAELGMTSPERRIGLMAHDFAQAVCAPQVLVTRAKKTGGTAMVAARWLTRMTALVKGIKGDNASLPQASRLARLGEQLDPVNATYDAPIAEQKPKPRPIIDVRPQKLSVTQIETLQKNPYAIYARHILGLKKLDPLEMPSTGAARGTFIHKILEKFGRQTEAGMPPNPEDLMAAIIKETAQEIPGAQDILRYWAARLEALTSWFIDFETERRTQVEHIKLEETGARAFDINGEIFTLTAKADRVEINPDKSINLLDYKTYRPPSAGDVKKQKNPQLLLEALIAQSGGFSSLEAARVAALENIHISGGHPEGEIMPITDFDDALAEAEQGLLDLVTAYLFGDAAFEPHTQPKLIKYADDYDHLARLLEWSSQEGEEA